MSIRHMKHATNGWGKFTNGWGKFTNGWGKSAASDVNLTNGWG
jgi:hypothetical protein